MKRLMMIPILLTLAACGDAAKSNTTAGDQASALARLQAQAGLPELNKIQSYKLARPYSYGGSYDNSALFLSPATKRVSGPDLLYNSYETHEGVTLFFEAATAGDDFSVIADLGPVPLETVKPTMAFNYDRIVFHDNTFKPTQPIVEGHTYAVLNSKRDVRSLFIVKVDRLNEDRSLEIRYAVKSFSLIKNSQEAPGWDWEAESK